MRKRWRNRKRWAMRRTINLHERLVERMWDELAEMEGRRSARIAALKVRVEMAVADEWANCRVKDAA